MKLQGSVTISRSSRDVITIRLRDELSFIGFAEIELAPHDFCMALTGLAEVKGKMACHGLGYVGKKKVMENRSIVCPIKHAKREDLSKWLEQNAQEEGWLLSTYLGSQSSVTTKDGVTTLHYSVTKYVEPQENDHGSD